MPSNLESPTDAKIELDRITNLLRNEYEIHYNSDKLDNAIYHRTGFNFFNNKKNIDLRLNNLVREIDIRELKCVVLIDAENIHHNIERKLTSKTSLLNESVTTIEESLPLYVNGIKEYKPEDFFFVFFCQTHNNNFYNEYFKSKSKYKDFIYVISDAPSKSEADDILLFLAFKRLVMENIDVIVRSNDKMSWLENIKDSINKNQIHYITKKTQILLKNKLERSRVFKRARSFDHATQGQIARLECSAAKCFTTARGKRKQITRTKHKPKKKKSKGKKRRTRTKPKPKKQRTRTKPKPKKQRTKTKTKK